MCSSCNHSKFSSHFKVGDKVRVNIKDVFSDTPAVIIGLGKPQEFHVNLIGSGDKVWVYENEIQPLHV